MTKEFLTYHYLLQYPSSMLLFYLYFLYYLEDMINELVKSYPNDMLFDTISINIKTNMVTHAKEVYHYK